MARILQKETASRGARGFAQGGTRPAEVLFADEAERMRPGAVDHDGDGVAWAGFALEFTGWRLVELVLIQGGRM
jgi:hypothetical protein